LSTAEALRAKGYDGKLALIGAEWHLPYDRPPLSKQVLSGSWEPDRVLLRDAQRPRCPVADEHGRVAVRVGQEPRDGRRTDDGTVLDADVVVVAVGSIPATAWLADS